VTDSFTEPDEVAGLKAEAFASPRFLLPAGSELSVDTGPTTLLRV
jgi:hypothetical protein